MRLSTYYANVTSHMIRHMHMHMHMHMHSKCTCIYERCAVPCWLESVKKRGSHASSPVDISM